MAGAIIARGQKTGEACDHREHTHTKQTLLSLKYTLFTLSLHYIYTLAGAVVIRSQEARETRNYREHTYTKHHCCNVTPTLNISHSHTHTHSCIYWQEQLLLEARKQEKHAIIESIRTPNITAVT
jgi:hypothetical protein